MKLLKTVFILTWLLFYPSLIHAQIVLSEIMFNPQGNERYNEFIELYNSSDFDAVNLNGWLLSDGEKYNSILSYQDSTILLPRRYAVILVPNYYESSNEYDNIIPEAALKLTVNSSQFGAYGLANEREETVSIYTPDTLMVASWRYHIPNPDGISEEKRILEQGDDDYNWGHSLYEGGTPGFKNSLAPEEYDIAVEKESLHPEPKNPGFGESVLLSVNIKNAGLYTLNDVSVIFSFQTAGSTSNHFIGDTVKIKQIESFENRQIKVKWQNIPSGVHNVAVTVFHPLDQEPENNQCFCEIIAGYPDRALIINEIMYNPLPDIAEWIELYNPGSFPVNLKSWLISDDDTSRTVELIDSTFILYSQEFIIIAEDSTIYEQISPEAFVLIIKSFPALKSDYDGVILRDGSRNIIEQVFYEQSWGGAKGKSLERINPGVAANRKNNWATSVDASGHTAGRQNSVFTSVIPSNTTISISPDPFSPDGDGHDDFTAISYTLPVQTAHVNIRIFDIKGRLVRFLMNNEPSGSSGTIFWDGLNDEGLICRIGIYIILIEMENPESEKIDRVQKTVVLAKSL